MRTREYMPLAKDRKRGPSAAQTGCRITLEGVYPFAHRKLGVRHEDAIADYLRGVLESIEEGNPFSAAYYLKELQESGLLLEPKKLRAVAISR